MTLAYFYMWSIEKVTNTIVHYFLDFVEAECRCMNEVVIIQMKLAQYTKDVVQMLAVVPSASLLCPDKYILEVLTRAIRGGPNSQAILRHSLRLLAVQQNNTSIDRIWNGSNLVDASIKDGGRLPTVPLPFGRRWIRRPSRRVGYPSGASRVGTVTTPAMSLLECPKRRRGEISRHSSSWNPACSSLRISPLVSFVPRSTGQTLGTGGRAPTIHFWLVPFTQRSISSIQWKNSITLSFN